jgi:hypothetical protein
LDGRRRMGGWCCVGGWRCVGWGCWVCGGYCLGWRRGLYWRGRWKLLCRDVGTDGVDRTCDRHDSEVGRHLFGRAQGHPHAGRVGHVAQVTGEHERVLSGRVTCVDVRAPFGGVLGLDGEARSPRDAAGGTHDDHVLGEEVGSVGRTAEKHDRRRQAYPLIPPYHRNGRQGRGEPRHRKSRGEPGRRQGRGELRRHQSRDELRRRQGGGGRSGCQGHHGRTGGEEGDGQGGRRPRDAEKAGRTWAWRSGRAWAWRGMAAPPCAHCGRPFGRYCVALCRGACAPGSSLKIASRNIEDVRLGEGGRVG